MDSLPGTSATTRHPTTSWSRRLLVHVFWFIVAAAFVGILLLTYGLDLSLGFF
jgi:hypothetical protein